MDHFPPEPLYEDVLRLVRLEGDHITNYSDLCIFDALEIAKGPICRAKPPIRLRHQGLHGDWADGDKLAA